jgi:tetrahydromethanopterin S-methyltransferase subunit B
MSELGIPVVLDGPCESSADVRANHGDVLRAIKDHLESEALEKRITAEQWSKLTNLVEKLSELPARVDELCRSIQSMKRSAEATETWQKGVSERLAKGDKDLNALYEWRREKDTLFDRIDLPTVRHDIDDLKKFKSDHEARLTRQKEDEDKARFEWKKVRYGMAISLTILALVALGNFLLKSVVTTMADVIITKHLAMEERREEKVHPGIHGEAPVMPYLSVPLGGKPK